MKPLIASLALLASVQANAVGSIDYSFGATPPFTHFYDQPTDGFGALRHMATQADGKVVLVSSGAALNAGKGVLIRLNANGTRDWSFGQNGQVALSYSATNETTTNAVAVAADGALVTLSTARNCAPAPSLRTCVTVERLGKDGQRGPYISGIIDGDVLAEYGVDVLVETNGDVVTVGSGDYAASRDWIVRRWRFNGTSWQALLARRIDFMANGQSRPDQPTAIARGSNGKLLICGWTLYDTQDDTDFAIAQLKTDLTLDTSFSSDGKHTVAVDLPGSNKMDVCEAVALDSTGRIWLGGTARASNGYDSSVVTILTATGDLVTRQVHTISGWGSAITELLPTRDGTVLFAGSHFSSVGTSAMVGRLRTDATIDTSFGGNGLVSFNRAPFVPGALPYAWGHHARWQVTGGRTRVLVAGRQLHSSGDDAWGVFRAEVFP